MHSFQEFCFLFLKFSIAFLKNDDFCGINSLNSEWYFACLIPASYWQEL